MIFENAVKLLIYQQNDFDTMKSEDNEKDWKVIPELSFKTSSNE